jgi:tripartite-type tricarboxylate transporter receptor subunit TctC
LHALNYSQELKTHIRGAINNGVTKAEIREALLQVAVYCGMPAGLNGFKLAKEVFAEMGICSASVIEERLIFIKNKGDNMDRRQSLKIMAGLAASSALPYIALAQEDWPSKPVRIIVPVAPGGSADMLSRTMGERLGRSFNQTFIVENVSGGGGIIATQKAARAPADGYTMMLSYSATHGTNPSVRRVPYEPIAGFTPIAMIGGTPNVLVVSSTVPANNVNEFIKLLKDNPAKFSYGSAGAGTLTHLAMEQFKESSATAIEHIPYRGGSPMMVDLLGGQIHAGFPSLSTALQHIRSGRIRPLAVTSAKRHPLLPDVPTLMEAGLATSGSVQWYGFHGPANMPKAVVARLNEEINKHLSQPDLREKLAHDAIEIMRMTPDQFGEYVKNDKAVWTKLAATRKINLD